MNMIWMLPPPFNMIVLIVAIGCAFELIKTTIKQIRRFADNDADRRLRREMFESGVSVEEAEQWAKIRFARPDEKEPPGQPSRSPT